jgi:hypothetical protein
MSEFGTERAYTSSGGGFGPSWPKGWRLRLSLPRPIVDRPEPVFRGLPFCNMKFLSRVSRQYKSVSVG